ncbi:PREDICTED: F-box/kelch-repeat protein At2g43270-like [Camelina sativa]|uniref:F-box/kelch-repeat protein At2g43270-like n=1 Tax=Camelina sativa TaxID=90675 RepID=A0ABM0Z578_CAMSA|nr:PREDICTED: F-box/kelch-repeat protein At2g43270-like [Camelina sativa]
MYLIPDLVEEILLRLPLNSIFKFTTVSKQWKSIMRTRRFAERRIKLERKKKKKKPKFLAAVDHHHRSDSPRFEEIDEEINLVYLNSYDATTRPSLTCEGLVCIPVPGSVNVYNPCTGASISFPSGPDPVDTRYGRRFSTCYWWNTFPAYWVMGFGRDIVNGSYKVVRMFFNQEPSSLNIGEWKRSLNPPPYNVEARRKSAFVNGSIYWLEMMERHGILALDLHTEEFRDLPTPPVCCVSDQLVNLDDRLAIAKTDNSCGWRLEILCFDPQGMDWSLTYSIGLETVVPSQPWQVWFRPLAVSRKGNLFFCDSEKRLFKYCPETRVLRCIASEICVLSPFIEDLVSLPSAFSVPETLASKFGFFKWFPPSVLFATSLVSLVLLSHFVVSSRS